MLIGITLHHTVDNIEPTAEIIKILKPIYNFKATRPKSVTVEERDED